MNNQAPEKRGIAIAVNGERSGTTPNVVVDGPERTKTLRKIASMSGEALKQVLEQSEDLMGQVLQTYARDIAPGEVGEGGTALAGPQRVDGLGPTGLLYGRIQSGKTVAMITFTALAIDNGFRVVIVLTTNFLELVRQTRERFNDLGRALVRASTEPEEWNNEHEVEHLRRTVADRGLVMICAKHAGHLSNVRELLETIGAASYPALILDDEADQASLDNNERKRSKAKDPELVAATKVHGAIRDIRKALPHHVFLQVTATPYALLLQKVDSPFRPKFTFLLSPGAGYTGGEHFFSSRHIDTESITGAPPLCYVSEKEAEEIEIAPEAVPRGLENAIAFFLVAAAAQAIDKPEVLKSEQNFLCHTSQKRAEHDKLRTLIVRLVSQLADELEPLSARAKALLNWAYDELKKTQPDVASFDKIVEDIADRLPRRKIRLVNSDGKSGEATPGAPNFIIGGNIVGRGLTIPNLLVTYYLRKPKTSQMDTMLQHARMFGYRAHLMPYTRVFLPQSLAVRFWGIHQAEDELRKLLPNVDALDQVPVQVVGELKPTRYGVLDTGSIVTISSGKHLYPIIPTVPLPASREKKVVRIAKQIWPGWDEASTQPLALVPVEPIVELIDALSPNDWDVRAVVAILRSLATKGAHLANGTPSVFAVYRTMDRGQRSSDGGVGLTTGAVSGEERSTARRGPLPTFFLFRQVVLRERWNNCPFFYPTLIFPASMPNHIYNDSELVNDETS